MGIEIRTFAKRRDMIHTLYTIGKVLSKEEQHQKYFDPWEDPFPVRKTGVGYKVLAVMMKDREINDIQVEDFSSSKLRKYLFRHIRGKNGTNLVPTLYFQLSGKADAEKWERDQIENIRKLTKKVRQSIKNYQHDFLSEEELERLPTLLLLKSRELNKEDSHLFTMNLDGKYFGDFEQYRSLFEEEAYGKYYEKSSARDKICSLTYQKEKEVWGRIDTMGFTVNDIAFSRNGFSSKTSYKMLPVSPEAVKLLEGSLTLIFSELARRFYNLNYVIVPHFIKRADEGVIADVLLDFIEKLKTDTFETTGDSIIHTENILSAIAQRDKLQKSVYYDILFYQQQQAQFLIKIHLADVLPSRIKRIFEVKKTVENRYEKITKIEFENKKTREQKTKQFRINFGVIKDYFSKKVKSDYVYHPYFFKVLEAVFYGTFLDEQQIIKAFLKEIRTAFKQQNEDGKTTLYLRQTKETFTLYQYFLQLGLFKNKNNMKENHEQKVQMTAEAFIDQHSGFFDKSQYKVGVFLLGYLCAYLMGKQYAKLKSTPFMKQLNSLNIDEKTIKSILPKLINKLREYDTAVPALEEKIAKSLVTEHNLTKADISYTFTLGMILQKEFAKAYKKQQKEMPVEELSA